MALTAHDKPEKGVNFIDSLFPFSLYDFLLNGKFRLFRKTVYSSIGHLSCHVFNLCGMSKYHGHCMFNEVNYTFKATSGALLAFNLINYQVTYLQSFHELLAINHFISN